jgi:hypothetical protein
LTGAFIGVRLLLLLRPPVVVRLLANRVYP